MLEDDITSSTKRNKKRATVEDVENARRFGFMKGFTTCLLILLVIVGTTYSLKKLLSRISTLNPSLHLEKNNLD